MNTIKKILILLLIVVASASCNKFLDVNDDPSAPSDVALDLRLKPAILLSNGAAQWRGAREVIAIEQYVASRDPGDAQDCWKFDNKYFIWQNTLVWTYPNVVDIIVMGEDENSPHFSGVGKIFKAYLLLMLSDQLGSIPYDDLYNGRSTPVLEPRFEEQQVVYEKCLADLDEAIDDLSQTENAIELNRRDGDIIYQGDTERWIKFAYALKARYLNHYSKKSSLYDPAAVITACSKAFDGDGQDAEFAYKSDGSQTQANPFSAEGFGDFGGITPRYGGYSAFFVDMLKTSDLAEDSIDPRLPFIMLPADSTGLYTGIVSGRGFDTSPERMFLYDYSNVPGGFYSKADSPFPFITYSEVKFIEAEAKLRLGDLGGSRAAFKEGVLSNMRKLGVPDTSLTEAADSIDAMTDADFTPLNAGLHHIMTQKYIAMVFNPETWVDMRRMDYDSTIYHGLRHPENVNSIFADDEWIKAMVYEYNEENRNPNNIPNNVPEVRMKTPVWWDIPE